MTAQHRRTLKLAAGAHQGARGAAIVSLGPQGASVRFGARGTYVNASLAKPEAPSRATLRGARARTAPDQRQVEVDVVARVEDDGTVRLFDPSGRQLADGLARLAKYQAGANRADDRIRALLERACERINVEMKAYGTIHRQTPPPDSLPVAVRRTFPKPPPARPAPMHSGLFARLAGKRASIAAHNAEIDRTFRTELARWEAVKKMFDEREVLASRRFETALHSDVEFMQQTLEDRLRQILWPAETQMSFDVRDGGASVDFEVALAAIEDLPQRVATVPKNGFKLALHPLVGKSLLDHYDRYICGTGFRIVGESFAALPTVSRVVLAAYAQRGGAANDEATSDALLYRVSVTREEWSRIDFRKLASLDVVACLRRFDLSRPRTASDDRVQ
jgi:hypothetical protein